MTTSPGVPLYVCLGEANYVDGACIDMLARCVQVILGICFAYAVNVAKEEMYHQREDCGFSRGNCLLNGSCRLGLLGVVIVCSDICCFL
jgi:hypothetical protein